ncbi:site-specific DNA-methyltransferase [Moraxella bovoculi]|uniref:site-specific DNA-methyltransferase n=1 Tax=Moraxella bovoculi TaxID=386891 RepID=UPI00055F0797
MDFDTTQNIFIESDNLEALKILQKSYAGKIKMIYIDPPYNTGNDFIYHDDFSQSKKDYEIATGDRDINGELLKSFKKNSKDNGHYHSNWLNMMLPRFHLAHTLLSDDGVIFISIDDNEQAQLKLLCDEIFGGENFVDCLIWKSKNGGGNDAKFFSSDYEYVMVYAKDANQFELFDDLKAETTTNYQYEDEFGKYALDRLDKKALGYIKSLDYPITAPDGTIYTVEQPNPDNPTARWRWSEQLVKERYNELVFKNGYVYTKSYEKLGAKPRNLLVDTRFGRTQNGKIELKELFDNISYFSFPKTAKLIIHLLGISTNKNSIILDFFAGSATTAHAVMQLNAEDNGNRQFIMVQLPELTDEKSEAYKAGFKTISEISKERIRRAGAKIKAENPDKTLDTGFKVFKLSDSNFKAWQIDDDDIAKQLEMYIDPLKDNTNEMDIVYELLLKMGLKLTADIKFDNGIYWLTCENKSYAIVLNSLSQDEFNAIIDKKPAKTVVLDKVFLNDSEKSNVILQFKDAGLNFESI